MDVVGVTLCVITRVKTEQFDVGHRGAVICPTGDTRVCLGYERGTYIINTSVELKVRHGRHLIALGIIARTF